MRRDEYILDLGDPEVELIARHNELLSTDSRVARTLCEVLRRYRVGGPYEPPDYKPEPGPTIPCSAWVVSDRGAHGATVVFKVRGALWEVQRRWLVEQTDGVRREMFRLGPRQIYAGVLQPAHVQVPQVLGGNGVLPLDEEYEDPEMPEDPRRAEALEAGLAPFIGRLTQKQRRSGSTCATERG